MPQVPTYTRRPKKRTTRRATPVAGSHRGIGDFVSFGGKKKPPKKTKPPARPSQGSNDPSRSPKEEWQSSLGSGLAKMSSVIPSGGHTGALKAGLAGAAAGAEIDAAYTRYKERTAKAKAKAAKTTVSQSAMAKKAKSPKKDTWKY